MAKFAEVIECLKNGGTANRMAWIANGDKEIMMQVPQRISKEIVPKMTSLQPGIKPKISTVGSGEIEYHNQVLLIEFKDDEKTPARATYFIPTWEDIMANDWVLTQAEGSYKARLKEETLTLEENMVKLEAFMKTSVFGSLPKRKQDLMADQLRVFEALRDILWERCSLEDIKLNNI